MNNTNGLVGRYPGVEGMKTGFVCASGFNLVAVATRNGQRLIAVVMGEPSAADRTIKAATLLDKGFGGSGGGLFGFGAAATLESLPRSPVGVAPNMREEICVRRKGPPASEDELDRAPAVAGPTSFSDGGGGSGFFGGPSMALSAAGSSVRGTGGPRSLAARAPLEPVAVFLGRSPGSGSAPVAANARAIPARPEAPATATAFVGDRTRAPTPAGSAAGPMVLSPATMVPLKAGAGAAIGAGARPATTPRLGAITPKPTPAATPAAKAIAAPPPSTAKPAPARPSTAKPSTAKPSTAKPSTAKPSTAKPSTEKPSTPKPSAARPATAAKPPAAKPAATPAATPAAAPAAKPAPSATTAKKPATDG
jgi:D-alanyl-D-alanine carboxypeptidase